MTIAFDEFIKQNQSFPPQRMEGYGAIPLDQLSPSESEDAKKILVSDLYSKFDDTAVNALARIDNKYAIDVVSDFLENSTTPNGASLDCAKFLYDQTKLSKYAELMIKHLFVPSRFYRRSAINAVESLPATRMLVESLKSVVFTDSDDVNVFVAAKQIARRASLSDDETQNFIAEMKAHNSSRKKVAVDQLASKILVA